MFPGVWTFFEPSKSVNPHRALCANHLHRTFQVATFQVEEPKVQITAANPADRPLPNGARPEKLSPEKDRHPQVGIAHPPDRISGQRFFHDPTGFLASADIRKRQPPILFQLLRKPIKAANSLKVLYSSTLLPDVAGDFFANLCHFTPELIFLTQPITTESGTILLRSVVESISW